MDLTYWYYGLICLSSLLTAYILTPEGTKMASFADIQKLINNMQRTNDVVGRAAKDADEHAVIINSFEQCLNINSENVKKIAEYEKMMAAMDLGSNGGPVLDATFPSSDKAPEAASTHGLISSSTKGVGRFDQ